MAVLLVGIYSEGSVWLVRKVRRVLRLLGVGSKTKTGWIVTPASNNTFLPRALLPPPTFLLPTRDYRVPRIFTAQGPPNVKEGEDSLENRAVLGKRHRGTQVKFPYCLRCNHDTPGHIVEDYPLWKTCCWCLSTQHAHDECPSPHNSCSVNRCLVYFGHPNFGSYCSAIPAAALRHELEVAYVEAEWDNADTGYEGSDK